MTLKEMDLEVVGGWCQGGEGGGREASEEALTRKLEMTLEPGLGPCKRGGEERQNELTLHGLTGHEDGGGEEG